MVHRIKFHGEVEGQTHPEVDGYHPWEKWPLGPFFGTGNLEPKKSATEKTPKNDGMLRCVSKWHSWKWRFQVSISLWMDIQCPIVFETMRPGGWLNRRFPKNCHVEK